MLGEPALNGSAPPLAHSTTASLGFASLRRTDILVLQRTGIPRAATGDDRPSTRSATTNSTPNEWPCAASWAQ